MTARTSRETIRAMRYIALVLLTGCGPAVIAQTPRSITLSGVNQTTVAKATAMAQDHCQGYGRDAEMVPDAQPDGNATFKCVDGEQPSGPTITAAEERKRQQLEKQLTPKESKPTSLRGFFCSSSPSNTTAGFCVRDKAECRRTRDVSVGALPDLGECTLTEKAWCTGDLCFPSQEACNARRSRTNDEAPCEQRE